MSEWKTIPADEYCDSVRDGTHDTPKPTQSGFKLVTGKHLKKGVIDPSDAYFISESDYNKINERSKVDQWDVLMSMIGTIGEIAVVKDKPNYAIKNIALFKCGGSEIKGKWLAYYLSSPIAKGFFSGNQKGSSQQFLSLNQLRNLPILVADESYMKYVVEILSRYDTLIENYQKQIKLLEEAAQRLYKEWFVELRFPGYENTKIVDGVPEGWEKTKLGQLAEFKRGKTITKKEAIEGNIPVVAGGLEPAYYCDKSNTTDRVITISGSGANAGFTRMYFEKVWASDCSFVDTSATQYLHFVYCFLRENKTVIDNMQKGAAQPHVYAKDINSMELLLPIKKTLILHEQRASRFFDTIESLQSQIRLLNEARDRLLPKVMGGK